ncbi:MAG: CoA transferase [Alphaproteobacteria bacterium]|nr:CoA transferase [Alphaproteobacteria bacterium]
MTGVLEGIRVLDFGRYIAGPFCSALLGDMGADVIRIERPGGGEDRVVSPVTDDGISAGFFQLNRNKRSLTLNPTSKEGREIVKKLVATADVVVANLPPQSLFSMGLDLESLHAINPRVILTTGSAYGRGGPYSDRVGFDGIGQVMSGNTYMSGADEEHPGKSLFPYVDYGTATNCAMGTLAALMARERTGKGQMVEGSLLRTALTIANGCLIEEDMLELDRKPQGNRGYSSAPSDIFRAKDGFILAQVVSDTLFKRWTTLIGEPDWPADPRFKDDTVRGINSKIISDRMNKWCASYTCEEATTLLAEAKIPSGRVNSPRQALNDPHIQTMFIKQDYPTLKKPAQVVGPPTLLSDTPLEFRRRAPTVGEHTDEILLGLGYTQGGIAELRANNII